jgi:hypothetical protein
MSKDKLRGMNHPLQGSCDLLGGWTTTPMLSSVEHAVRRYNVIVLYVMFFSLRGVGCRT